MTARLDALAERTPRAIVQVVCARLRERASGGSGLAGPGFRWGWFRAIEAIEEDFLDLPMPERSHGQPAVLPLRGDEG